MMAKLFLLFTIVPAVELYLLLKIGNWMGAAETIFFLVATGLLGSFLAKREGLNVLRQLAVDLGKGIPPADRLMEGVLVVVGGVLLVTPGVLTDVVGYALLFPLTRRAIAPVARRWLTKRFLVQSDGFSADFGSAGVKPASPDAAAAPSKPFDHPAV